MCTRGELIRQGRLKVADMADDTVKRILEQVKIFVARGYKVTFAPMGMGEPLLFKNLYPLIGDLKGISPKVKVEIVTNGVLLDGRTAKKLVDLGVDEINVSLNVNNSADYKKYIGGDKYQLVVDNIKKLILYRNKRAAEGTNVFIQYLNYAGEVNKFNHDMSEWSKIMKYGDKCFVHPIVNEGGFNKNMVNMKKVEAFPCTLPIRTVAVRVNGDIYTCDATFFNGCSKIDDLYLGNINEIDYFKEIYSNKNSKIYKIVEMMKRGDYSKLRNCRDCNNYKLAPNPFFRTVGSFGRDQKWW